jgi:GAF domain-containing protein
VRGEPIAHVADAREEEAYRSNPAFRELVDVGGLRAVLDVGLRKGDALLGIIALYRQEVRPFSKKQIALLENFGAQAGRGSSPSPWKRNR